MTLRVLIVGLSLCVAHAASAFCGFFVAGSDAKLTNNASQVVLLRDGGKTSMTMSNTYKGPPENFAMVVPVPVVLKKEDVKTLPADVFDHIDALSAPRLVEYWEQDPCQPLIEPPMPAPPGAVEESGGTGRRGDLGVKVEARFAVGEYAIVVLSARDSSGLDTWLRQNKYTIPKGAGDALAPYVRDQMKFFVAKVDIKKVKRDPQGLVVLSPLRIQFEAHELRLPVRLGLLNADGKQDLIVYILHPSQRFEVANYPNVFIPTNLEVADEVRKAFPAFYAELFDQTIAKLNNRAVVTEYAWQTSGCDPCPTPPLDPADLVTLGAEAKKINPYASWVLTRLHTRYAKETLSEDLVFREAKAVTGGRANWNGTSGDAGAAVTGGVNNFQGRYIIRHYWTGAVQCAQPRYDTWGGPAGGGSPAPTAARGLAMAPRGALQLKKVVRSPVPTLGIPGTPPPRRPKK